MGRITRGIKLKGKPTSTDEKDVFCVFDTGSERNYVKKDALPSDVQCSEINHFATNLGGKSHDIKERCTLVGEIEGLPFDFSAHVIDTIGNVDNRDVDLVIGATAMEEWDMVLSPKGQKIDLNGLKKREFIEL